MKLEDKYKLKKNRRYKHYNDDVLDFITVYTDFFIRAWEYEKRENVTPKIRNFIIQKGLLTAEQKYNFKFPPLIELKTYFENKFNERILKNLD